MDAGPLGLAARIAMSVKNRRQAGTTPDPSNGDGRLPFDPQSISSQAQAGIAAPPGVPTSRITTLGGVTCYDNTGAIVPCDGFDEINGGGDGFPRHREHGHGGNDEGMSEYGGVQGSVGFWD